MERTAVGTSAAPSTPVTVEPKLKAGAIGFVSNLVISVASVAPAYSLAATLGYIATTQGLGYHSPAAIWVAFFPIIAIASAYYWLNRADPDCGTTFAWVTRAMGPFAGWQAGWAVLVADVLVIPSLADVAGNYTIQLWDQIVGSHASSTLAVVIIGVVWIIVMTGICFIGIELSARIQRFLLGMEFIVLVVFAVTALVKVYTGHPPHSVRPQLEWFNPGGISFGALINGILLAIFIYWGWDTGVAVNEETADATAAPGRSAMLSNVALIGIYLLVTVAVQAYGGLDSLIKNSADVFAPLGRGVLGSGLDWLLILAVLSSASASTQTTILPGARTTLSMGRARALPRQFAEIHPRFLSPGFSTLFVGALSLVVYVAFSISSHHNLIADAFTSLSLTIAFYYGITGFACVVYYRRQLFTGVRHLLLLGVVPLLGGAALFFIMIKAIITYSARTGGYARPLFGIGSPIVIAMFTVAVGLVLTLLQFARERAFFSRRAEVADPRVLEPGWVPAPTEG